MKISADTKISAILKANPASLETIVSIDKHFEKLRNPVLRKVLAPRVTIAEAAKIGKCSVETFFEKLKAIGFEIEDTVDTKINSSAEISIPEFVVSSNETNTHKLDVRLEISSGRDPFQIIMKAMEELPKDFVLLLINSFEPVPLIKILNKKGYLSYVKNQDDGTVLTYFKKGSGSTSLKNADAVDQDDFISITQRFCGKIKTIDVRNLEMPLPMTAILSELEMLPSDMALFVHHKKVPQFLLPELQERKFKWSMENISENEVDLIIYK